MEQAEFVFGTDVARVRVLPQRNIDQAAGRADLVVFFYAKGGISTFLDEHELARLGVRATELKKILDTVMECDAFEELLRLREHQQLSPDEHVAIKHVVNTQLAAAQSDDLPLYSAFVEGIAKAVLFSHLLRQIVPIGDRAKA
jgi:hypothetical protein